MSTTQFAPQLRPLSVGEVLDASFKVVRQSFGTLAALRARRGAPAEHHRHADPGVDERQRVRPRRRDDGRASAPAPRSAGALLTSIISLVLTTIAAAACFRAVSGAYLGEQPTVGESLSFAATGCCPVIWLSLLYALGPDLPFLLLIIPGIWLVGGVVAELPGAAVRGRAGRSKALGRSFRLVKGRWWPTFGALVVMYLIVIVISGILGGCSGAIADRLARQRGGRGGRLRRSSTRCRR